MVDSVTVEKLAEQVGGISLEKLIEQLNRAGVTVAAKDDVVTDEDRRKLLALLKVEHGADEVEQPKKISLKRTSISEIKVKRASGQNSTVSVVRKRRRVYVKRNEQEEENLQDTAEVKLNDEDVIDEVGVEAKEETKTDGLLAKEYEELESEIVAEAKPEKAEESESKKLEKVVPDGTADKDKDKDKDKLKRSKAKGHDSKKDKDKEGKERRKSKSKLIEESESRGVRRAKPSKFVKARKLRETEVEVNPHAFAKPVVPIIYDVNIPETIVVSDLAKGMSVKAGEVIKIMMKLGAMATINQVIDQETASIIVEEMGHRPILENSLLLEESLAINYEADHSVRTPVVAVMGHVDHGKTSLLDYIRESRVTSQEAGGITQHIGAYQVKTERGSITFLDTPGHSAFTAMRARGASCTDIVILVVAADDGVMPQTIEAIQHAKAAGVPIIVAVNKIDKPESDVKKVVSELSQYELIPEDWGGDTMFVHVSAKDGTGINELLEAIMLQSEVMELRAVSSGPAQGVVIEARMDRGRGAVASVLIQSGELCKGDMVLAGLEYGRVKVLANDQGAMVDVASPSVPVEILGLSGVPQSGDSFQVVEDERKAREVALFRQGKHRDIKLSRQRLSNIEGFMDRIQQGDVKVVNIVLKADVQGSVEALTESLEKLTNDEISVKVISRGVGGFNESDINLAIASDAVLIGFNVRAGASARKLAAQEGVEINYYSIIYEVVEGIRRAMLGRLSPRTKENILGLAEVRDVFRSAKIGSIAGCMVIDGIIKRGNPIRVLRDNVVIYKGELESLRRFKDNVSEVRNGMECGIGVKNYNDVKVGDQIEVFEVIEVMREDF